MRVRQALEDFSSGALRRIATTHGLAVDEVSTRADLVERLALRLEDASFLRELVDGLPDDERAALLAARANGGDIRGFLLERDFPGAAEALVERGLLFRTFAASGARRGEVFSLADETRDLLPPPVENPLPASRAEAPGQRRSTDPAFSLFALASAVQRPGSKLEAEVQGWSEEPGGWERSARWGFVRYFAIECDLLVAHGSEPLQAGGTLPRWLNDAPGLAERLQRTYVHDRGWSDLAHAGIDDGEELADAALVRAPLIEAVERLPVGQWVALYAFSEWLQKTQPELLREQLDAHGRLVFEKTSWEELEWRLIRYVVLGPLYWLGKVACTADGVWFCRRQAPAPMPAAPCTWQGPSELVASPRTELGTLLEAERYLLLDERGRTSRYHLQQQHVAAALSSGGSVGECRRLLTRLCGGELPSTVQERLARWNEQFGAVSLKPVVLLEARTPLELEEVLADAAVNKLVQRRLSPTAAEVAASAVLDLAKALRGAGQLPRIDAALRLDAEPRRAYATMIDEQVLEFLLVSLLAFQIARPERLAELEGATSLVERLQRQFSTERLRELRTLADGLARDIRATPPPRKAARRATRRR